VNLAVVDGLGLTDDDCGPLPAGAGPHDEQREQDEPDPAKHEATLPRFHAGRVECQREEGMEPLAPPTNPYAPPRAELDAPDTTAASGFSPNLEAALAGRYDFTIGDVMDEAWRLVKGMKATFWGAAVVIGIIQWIANSAFQRIIGSVLPSDAMSIMVIKQFLSTLAAVLLTPVTMGLSMMCVRRAIGAPISFAIAFSYVSKSAALVAGVLVVLATYAGLLALIIPGIYLMVAYSFVIQLVGDLGLSPWQAMETSRKAVTHRWWRVFGLGLVVAILTGLSALGLLIPLIWTIPWMMMTIAVLYRRIFYSVERPTDGATT
jgi:hypothetical protein